MTDIAARIGMRSVPALCGFFVFGLLAVLFVFDRDIYFRVLNIWRFEPYRIPFIDSLFMYNMKKCWLDGADIYRSIPCDIVPGNKMAYSPLWPRLPFLSSDAATYGIPIAILTNSLLILSTFLLPAVRTGREALLLTLTLISPPFMFAMERNNIDVWFYLTLCGIVLLMARSLAFRFVAYGVVIFSGLLKYYPLIWLTLALRERLSLAIIVAAASVMSLAIFVWVFSSELMKSLANVPFAQPFFFSSMSVIDIPRGVARVITMAGQNLAPGEGLVVLGLRLVITAYILIGALRLSFDPRFRSWLANAPVEQSRWLVAGSITIAGCYLAVPNEIYRAIYMLFVVAALLAMTRAGTIGVPGVRLAMWPGLIVALLWAKPANDAITALLMLSGAPDSLRFSARMAVWAVEKLAWIFLIRLLLAVVLAWIMNGRSFSELSARFPTFAMFRLKPSSARP